MEFLASHLVMLALMWLIAFADAHTVFTTLYVDDVSQGDGTCVRMNMDPQTCTNPIASLESDDMACGVYGQRPVLFTCPAPAGGKLTFEWRLWADLEQPGALDPSHKGPCAIYAKQIHNMATDSAAGPGWIKLWDEGYDETSGKWCTEKLIENDGRLDMTIPAGLPGGNWLFRPELLALQNADKGDPQFYIGCAQVFVENSDTDSNLKVPAALSVDIPGHVRSDDPGLTFNIYAPQFPYITPGPDAFQVPSPALSSSELGTNGGAGTALTASYSDNNGKSGSSPKIQGAIPSNYLVKNANWVGFEVPEYEDEDGCWAASEDCWDQAGQCYDEAPPTGSVGCRVWEEKKCEVVQQNCADGNFVGPPEQGKKLG